MNFFLKLDLFMGHKKTEASYDYRSGLINTACEAAQIKDKKEIDLSLSEKISGTLVSVGNPHFVIQEKKEPLWLLSYGSAIEKHNFFPEKTNVELLIKREKGLYELFIHERGVGYTAACGSGAAAATWLLFEQKEIQREEKISISMPGGTLISWITKEQKIALEASAQLVFDGFLTIDEAGY